MSTGNKKTKAKHTRRRAALSSPLSPLASPPACELCSQDGGDVVWRDALCRVVIVNDPDYPGYCRVVWNAHVREMSDLKPAHRAHCMRVVFAVERVLRDVLKPHKINLACLGNMTPHIHWHVIARDEDDAHFPLPVWGERQRSRLARRPARYAARIAAALAEALGVRPGRT